MPNQWVRLWTDMPNDPKWRTIARASKQPISAVIAVFVHMMTNAANANERGRTQVNNSEDIASALDMEPEDIDAIYAAMQGRVLDGDRLIGWEKRQPLREDGSSERSKEYRERKRTQTNANDQQIRVDTEKIIYTTTTTAHEDSPIVSDATESPDAFTPEPPKWLKDLVSSEQRQMLTSLGHSGREPRNKGEAAALIDSLKAGKARASPPVTQTPRRLNPTEQRIAADKAAIEAEGLDVLAKLDRMFPDKPKPKQIGGTRQ